MALFEDTSIATVKRRKCHSPSTGINKARNAAKQHTTPKTITHNTAFSGVSAGVERLWFNKKPSCKHLSGQNSGRKSGDRICSAVGLGAAQYGKV